MNALLALSYADRRAFVNGLAALRKRPWRVLVWAFWLVLIAGFGWLRTAGPSAHRSAASPWQIGLEDVWVCGFAAVFGIVLATGSARFVGFFSSRAEALALVRAPLAPPFVAAYLQARAVALTLAQTFVRFAYVIVIGVPTHTTPLGLLRELALVGAATIALSSTILPRALVRGAGRVACIAAGCAIVPAAVLAPLRDALGFVRAPAAAAVVQRLPAWHPGLLFDAVARGDLAPIGWALLVALAGGAAFTAFTRDAYPELYAISIASLEFRAQLTARAARAGERDAIKRTRVVSARAALRGALAFVWLDAVTWSRRVSPTMTALLAVLALGLGAGLGLFARHNPGGSSTNLLLTVLGNGAITLASTTGIRLAPELRRPLFWLGDVPLLERLAAWAYASLWRDATLYALAALSLGVVAGNPGRSVALFVAAVGIGILTRAAGLAIFALLPNALDQRGPAVFLRLLLSYALVAPTAAGAVIVGLLTRSLLAGSVTALVLAAAEAGVLIGFAAWRLAGRVDRLAAA